MDRFHYLHYGLSTVLVLIGIKMLGAHYVDIPTEWTLAIVLLVLERPLSHRFAIRKRSLRRNAARHTPHHTL